jgi:CheY-like chemotaxis protein
VPELLYLQSSRVSAGKEETSASLGTSDYLRGLRNTVREFSVRSCVEGFIVPTYTPTVPPGPITSVIPFSVTPFRFLPSNQCNESYASTWGAAMTVGSQPAILVVDDSEAVCLTLSMMLEQNGYRVRVAHNSAETMRALLEDHFDLVLMDMNLGPESGCDLAEQLLQAKPRQRVIIMTGAVNTQAELQLHAPLGAVPVLLKPFSRNELLDCLRNALGRAA